MGNQAFVQYLTSQPGADNYRVTHTTDPVPKVPWTEQGYTHLAPEYWISSGNNVPVTSTDIQVNPSVTSGGDSGEIPIQDIPGIDASPHTWYFNDLGNC